MLYFLAATVLMWLGLLSSFEVMRLYATNELTSSEVFRLSAAAGLPSIVITTPVVVEMVRVVQMHNGGVSMDGLPLFPWLTGIGGAMGAAIYGAQLLRQRNAGAKFLAVGKGVTGFLLCCYMIFVAADQFAFFDSSKQDAGIVNWAHFKEAGSVLDVQCDNELMVIRDVDSDEVTYRCPSSILLGQFTTRPFVPWPSYTEGTSRDLARALRSMHNQAEKLL